jgi:hypothetical protein
MTENNWAEGSGSTWEDLDGDPRIVPGTEVLVGKHREVKGNRNWNDAMFKHVGRCFRVISAEKYSGGMDEARLVRLEENCWSWRARDLVCLRTADGELTDEGATLGRLDGWATESNRLRYAQCDARLQWALRAGLLEVCDRLGERVWVNQARLAMALGREPTAEKPIEKEPVRAVLDATGDYSVDETWALHARSLHGYTRFPSDRGVDIQEKTTVDATFAIEHGRVCFEWRPYGGFWRDITDSMFNVAANLPVQSANGGVIVADDRQTFALSIEQLRAGRLRCLWLPAGGLVSEIALKVRRTIRERRASGEGTPRQLPVAPPTAPMMCARCGVQPRLPLEACRGVVAANGLCGDCFTEWAARNVPGAASPAADHSGEGLIDSLRDWVNGKPSCRVGWGRPR